MIWLSNQTTKSVLTFIIGKGSNLVGLLSLFALQLRNFSWEFMKFSDSRDPICRDVYLAFSGLHCSWARKCCLSNYFADELNIANRCVGEFKMLCECSIIWLNEFMCFSLPYIHHQHHQARSSWRNSFQRQGICHFLCESRFIAPIQITWNQHHSDSCWETQKE